MAIFTLERGPREQENGSRSRLEFSNCVTPKIELPDEQLQIINEQARAHGYEDSGKYLASVAEKLARQEAISVDPQPSPKQLAREERLLLEVLNDDRPSIVATPEWWANFRAEMEAKLNGEAG